MTDAIRLVGLQKSYGGMRALDQVDLSVSSGEACGLVGANGAGKTSLIKCLLDLASRDAGEASIFGIDARSPLARRRLAYLPERFSPPHYLRGGEYLATMFELAGERHDAERVAQMMAALELDAGALARPVRTLSKGMTQKLGLAACFLVPRDLYVLDEPMSGLDPAARVAVKDVLRRLHGEGRTLFFTSHVLADVEELCSSLAVLERGRLRFRGAPSVLCGRYGEQRLEAAFMRCIRDDERALSA
jgi:ABC-2 type transport system ATP-binding protein